MTIQLCDCITRRHATTIWTHLQSPTKWVVELQTHIENNIFKKFIQCLKSHASAPIFFWRKKWDFPHVSIIMASSKLSWKFTILLISKPLEQLNQIKLFTQKFERCLQSCTYKRRWGVENDISHKIWPFWVQCHVFWFYECPCNFSTHNEWHI